MIVIAYDATGAEVSAFSGKNDAQIEANVPPGGGWYELRDDDPVEVGQGYAQNGVRYARPTLALPGQHTIPVDTDWTLADIPEGTAVLIDGAEAGTVDDGELVLTFPEARVWKVGLRPPFPWLDANCEVTVT